MQVSNQTAFLSPASDAWFYPLGSETAMEKQDKFLILVSDLLVYKRQVARVQLSTLDCLTESKGRPIVVLWEELTPRGNMVHQEVER